MSAVCDRRFGHGIQSKGNTRQKPEKLVTAPRGTVKGWGENQETGKHVACEMLGAGLDCQAATKRSWQPLLSR